MESRVGGSFLNREKFLLKDFNEEGLHLVANFAPIIGSRYKLTFTAGDETRDIEISVVHVKAGSFNADDSGGMSFGVLYSVGARIIDSDSDNRRFLKRLLYSYS